MNFAAFQVWREQCLRARPGLVDCGETNLYRALADLRPPPVTSRLDRVVHRCDLARLWLRRYAFPESLSRRALVCRGVRHALQLIFRELARTNGTLWVPADVYPVYQELARATGIEPRSFPTLPAPKLPTEPGTGIPEYLLVASPWKPLGRFASDEEIAAIAAWLDASPRRRLIIDCVYDLGAPFHRTTRRLLEGGKAILLHSVTKGWLWPKTCGVALLSHDHPELEHAFRDDPPSQAQLQQGESCLTDAGNLPRQVIEALDRGRRALVTALPEAVSRTLLLDPSTLAPGCYFFPVQLSVEELLSRHGMVGVPGTAFGGHWTGSVLTSLSERLIPILKVDCAHHT